MDSLRKPDKIERTNYYDNILMLMLNEKAFSTGLIDKKTKDRISTELFQAESIKLREAK